MAITFDPNPTTELEAVNMMLLSIGKSPVNTLPVAGVNDVSWAQTTLYNVTRDVQHRKWWFNRESCYPITPTPASGGTLNALLPASCLDMTPIDRTKPLVERNGMLYDTYNHSFDVTPWLESPQPNGGPPSVINVDLTWCFPYAQIPQAARMYIAMRAARQFQTSAVGSQILYQFTKEMELEAKAELDRSELRNSQTNMFTSPTRNGRIFNRQPFAAKNNAWY